MSKIKRIGIMTGGGDCPGLNAVIRAVAKRALFEHGWEVFGIEDGYEGLIRPRFRKLEAADVSGILTIGGTILGTSNKSDPYAYVDPRGASTVKKDVSRRVIRNVREKGLDALFLIGGDGTMASAVRLSRAGLKIVGVPKTIDNDLGGTDVTFGFDTAVSESRTAIDSAHAEALGARNGVGLVKLMGRESGFIAAYATMANSDVNFCLIPEAPFTLESFLKALKERLKSRGHAVIVAGEGAGQNLMQGTGARDASGNIKFSDIGLFLKDQINGYFKKEGMELNLKYIDPSYTIRSLPANPRDSAFCLLLGRNAVHAGMSGRTGMVVANWKGEFTHVPIHLAVSSRKKIDPSGRFWSTVLSCTGQPMEMG